MSTTFRQRVTELDEKHYAARYTANITAIHKTAYLHACDLAINHMTLKLKNDLDILKMCLHTENARSRHSKLLSVDETYLKLKNMKIALKVKGQG